MAADRKSLTGRRLLQAAKKFYELRVARDLQRLATDVKWRHLPPSVKRDIALPWNETEQTFREELARLLHDVAPQLQYTIKLPSERRFSALEITQRDPVYVSFHQVRQFLEEHNRFVLMDAGDEADPKANLRKKIRTSLWPLFAGRGLDFENIIAMIAGLVEEEVEERAL